MRWKKAKGKIEHAFVGPPKEDFPPISELIQNGLAHHQAGRLQEAEATYQSILQEQPQHHDLLVFKGNRRYEHQRFDRKHRTVDMVENSFCRIAHEEPRNTGASHCSHDHKIGLNLVG